jgi:uroporphyrinogen decarboxylase
MLDRILAAGPVDRFFASEDMAYKGAAMISPEMVRRFCLPSWTGWGARVRAAGVPLYDIDSDGFIGELIAPWLEAGVNVCDPVEVAAHNDLAEFRRRFGRRMAYRGGIDKRAMAAGGAAMRAELRRVAPVVRDGGYIPGCDHGVPPDVSWPDFVDYGRELARLTGWL